MTGRIEKVSPVIGIALLALRRPDGLLIARLSGFNLGFGLRLGSSNRVGNRRNRENACRALVAVAVNGVQGCTLVDLEAVGAGLGGLYSPIPRCT